MKVKAIALLTAATVLGCLTAGTSHSAFAGGLKVFLDSTIELDEAAGTITLPLFRGTHEGDDVFYIITESSDRETPPRHSVSIGRRSVSCEKWSTVDGRSQKFWRQVTCHSERAQGHSSL